MNLINMAGASVSNPMISKNTIRLLLVINLVSWQGISQAADLVNIYQTAKQHDPVYAAAQSTWAATQEKLPQARALLMPNVELSATTTYNNTDTDIQGSSFLTGGSQDFNSNSVGVSLRQPLYRKQNWVQYEQSALQLEQADAQLTVAKQNLILRVAQAYFDVLAAQDNIVFISSQKQAIEKQLTQAKRKLEVGTNTITDVHEAQARYDLVTAQAVAAKNALHINIRALSKIIGTTPHTLATLNHQWKPSRPDPGDESQWMVLAVVSNPDVIIQEALFEIADREVARQQAGHLPTLDLLATYQDDSANGSATFNAATDSTTKSIGLQLSIPLYNGGGTSSRKREALHVKEALRYELDNAKRNAEFDSSQAFLGVINGIAQVTALEQAVVSNESSLKSSERGWELGTRTAVDVLNAQQQLYSAKRDLQQARYDTLISQLQLDAAVGRLTERNLMSINAWLIE